MKRFALVFSIVVCCLILTACNKVYNLSKNVIAEMRYNIFAGQTDNFKVTFMSGKREKDYVINGYNTPLIDFGVITVTLLNPETNCDHAQFALTVETLRYSDEFEKNPFDGTLVADIKTIIDTDEDLTLKVLIGEINEDIVLKNISKDWEVDSFDALKIASKELKPELKSFVNKEFLGEVYVKIIEDDIVKQGQHYWYVNFVSRNGNNHSIIIDPLTSKILAKK